MASFLLWIIAIATLVLVFFVQKGFNEVIRALEAIHARLEKPAS